MAHGAVCYHPFSARGAATGMRTEGFMNDRALWYLSRPMMGGQV